MDQLTASYPWHTPYQFAGNKLIIAKDLDGLEEKVVVTNFWASNDGTLLSNLHYGDINFSPRSYPFSSHANIDKYGTTVTLHVAYFEGASGCDPLKFTLYIPAEPESKSWFSNFKFTGGYQFTIEYGGYLVGQGMETCNGEGEIIEIGNLLSILGMTVHWVVILTLRN